MKNTKYIYRFKPWIPVYSLALGISQLLVFNLTGFLWIYWWQALKHDKEYQPIWLYRFHMFYTASGLLLLIAVFTPFRKSLRINLPFYQIQNPSLLFSLVIVIPSIIVYALPLWGIKKEKISNEVASSNGEPDGANLL